MTPKHKIINDPVYDGFLNIDDPLILQLIDHPYLQRLRRIKQLGMADLVYPGAVHSRFSHSLGALNLMCRALDVLRSKGIEISDDECRAAKAAILLHDIGHGPGSHTLENIIVHVPHETVTQLLMQHINRQLGGQLDTAIAIFNNQYHKHFLHQLVSSQLDMDRLDYLSRDSYFTGVREGIVGTDRIIYMLNVKDDELVVDEKGIYSVEQFLISRRLMYWQVYMHKTVVAAEIMLRNFFQRAIQLGHAFTTHSGLGFFINAETVVDQRAMQADESLLHRFAQLDDNDLYQCLKESHDDPILDLIRQALLGRRLLSVTFSDQPFTPSQVEQQRNRLATIQGSWDAARGIDPQTLAQYLVGTGELRNRSYDFNDHEIKVLRKDGTCLPIAQVSDQLDRHFLQKTVTKHYLFFPKTI